jgi:hypothetical protein
MTASPTKWLAIALYFVDAVLVTAYLVGTFGINTNPHVYRLINLDAEGSFAAWFSASQLFTAGFVFAAAALLRTIDTGRIGFCVLWSMAFFFLSADEAVALHEKVTLIFRDVQFLPRFSGNHGVWIPLYSLLGVTFVAIIAKPSLQLRRSGNRGITVLFIGIAIFVFGAVVIEIASYGALRDPENRYIYQFQVVVEEALELIGVSTILLGAIQTCFEQLSPSKRLPELKSHAVKKSRSTRN